MIATWGHIHNYLGMCFDFSQPHKFCMGMDAYIRKVIDDFPEEITGVLPSPAADHLYQICDPTLAKPLCEKHAVTFHHTVAQLLFASMHACRDIQVAILLLTTCVKHPDEDDWGKLKCVLMYLNGTKFLKLTL